MTLDGKKFGKYILVKKIASGGMAEIFLARMKGMEGFDRDVCIKRIHRHLSDDPEFIKMFLDEARLMARLSHPNIVSVYEFGKVGQAYYLALEYIHGVSLAQIVKKSKGIELQYAVKIAAEICAALHYAHNLKGSDGKRLGIVHRDVSPQNILISYEGTVKMIDFGVAKATTQLHETKAGTFKGKYAYMSPEQCRSENIDHRSDVFPVGILLYEMLTGMGLFHRENFFDTMEAVLHLNPPLVRKRRPEFPPETDEIIAKAMAKDRNNRYQTAAELQLVLEELAVQFKMSTSSILLSRYIKNLFSNEIEQDELEELSPQEIEEVLNEETGEVELFISSNTLESKPANIKNPIKKKFINESSQEPITDNDELKDWDDDDNDPTIAMKSSRRHDNTTSNIPDFGEQTNPEPKASFDDIKEDGLITQPSPLDNSDTLLQDSQSTPNDIEKSNMKAPTQYVRKNKKRKVAIYLTIIIIMLGCVITAFIYFPEIKTITKQIFPQEQKVIIMPDKNNNNSAAVKTTNTTTQEDVFRFEDSGTNDSLNKAIESNKNELVKTITNNALPLLSIKSIPDGADVWIDNNQILEQTPILSYEIIQGKHLVKIEKEGMISWENNFEFKNGEQLNIEIILAEQGKKNEEIGKLFIDTNPQSQVFIDGKIYGYTPLQNLCLNSGEYNLIFKNENIKEVIKSIKVLPNKTSRFTFDLNKIIVDNNTDSQNIVPVDITQKLPVKIQQQNSKIKIHKVKIHKINLDKTDINEEIIDPESERRNNNKNGKVNSTNE